MYVMRMWKAGVMTPVETYLFLIPTFLATCLNTVECLKCVQCSSLSERMCKEGRIAPENCPQEKPALQYCITYKGFLNDGTKQLVVRDCSPLMEKTGCRMVEFDHQMVRTCFTSCQEDGCNGGSNSRPHRSNRRWTIMCLHTLITYVVTANLST